MQHAAFYPLEEKQGTCQKQNSLPINGLLKVGGTIDVSFSREKAGTVLSRNETLEKKPCC
jgi:hypothetical protein